MKTTNERFWSKVEHIKSPPCWMWTGSNNAGTDNNRKWPYGHLRMFVNDKWRHVPAHRVSWELHYGPIPKGIWVLHKCDNTLCVRPDHLFLGTAKANTDDMKAKGRSKFGGGIRAKHNKPIGPRLNKLCLGCGTAFSVRPSEEYRKYCGHPCSMKHSKNVGRKKGTSLSPEALNSFRKKRGWLK